MFSLASVQRWLASRLRVLSRTAPPLGRAGAVALITAISAPMLVMIVGFVVDFSYASYINQRLARATDAATLGSVSQTAATAAGGYGDLAFLQTTGVNYFNANTAQLGLTGVNFSLSVTSDGIGGVTASGSYSYNVPTFFASALGFSNIPVSGSAKTSARPLVYVNYYILVDTSQSMGIAATQADMNALYNRVVATGNWSKTDYPGCVFGCHVKATRFNGTTYSTQPYTNEDLAHNSTFGSRINLRIDAAVSAVQGIISTAASIASTTKNIQFALYKIQLDPSNNNLITEVQSLSSNYSTLQSMAGTIDLGNNNGGGAGDSDFPDELTAFNTKLTLNGVLANGSGASATSPLNFIFIISDGLFDVTGPCWPTGHCTAPLNPANCIALKAKATVGTIYTTYAPIYNANNPGSGALDGDFVNTLAKQWTMPVDQLAQAMQSCASSSDYAFQANEGPEIIAAMQTLFLKTQPSSARITQ